LEVTVTASTGARIRVWREDDLFHARPDDVDAETQICVAVDLFEVIAELAGLDLDDVSGSSEAIGLAHKAQRRLGASHSRLEDGVDVE
jgi:hypothetical protein